MDKRKCPICRGGIIMVYQVQFIEKKQKEENEKKEKEDETKPK